MLDGLSLITPEVLLFVVLGATVCTFIVIIPGLGGSFTLAMLLPFVFTLDDPLHGIALIIAVTVVSGTGNTLTSVLFGIPGSASAVASTFDGYPMTQRGEGLRAVGAGLSASVLGGVIGAIVLALSIPIMRPLVLAFRPPEFFALILLAMVFMAFAGGGDRLKAFISGGLGIMVSFIGMDGGTATQRWTFGELYLWDGLELIPMLVGLYAVSEMISLMRRGGAMADRPVQGRAVTQLLTGMRDTMRHWRVMLQSSFVGLWSGLAPGMGDSAAQMVGYTQAARFSKNRENFGKGEVEGVVAADAVTNSSEGAALIPTLALGIPGSSGMAIVLAGLMAIGLQPGPAMLTENVDVVYMIVGVLIIANIVAASLCLGIAPAMLKVTRLRASLVVPPILIAASFGAFTASGHFYDILVLLLAGLLGTALKEFGYSRPIFLIGFVLGPLVEHNYNLSMRIFGPGFLTRPITLALLGLIVLVVLGPFLVRLFKKPGQKTPAGQQ